MDNLNYSRQLVKYLKDSNNANQGTNRILTSLIKKIFFYHDVSVKYLLPKDGNILDYKAFKNINTKEELRLPFEYICLEYQTSNKSRRGDLTEQTPTKRIIYAHTKESNIIVTIVYQTLNKQWLIMPQISIPRTNYLDKDSSEIKVITAISNVRINATKNENDLLILISFLNAMRCKNVIPALVEHKNRIIKNTIPFDSYYYLTVDSVSFEAMNPQEKTIRNEPLLKGHIRRFTTGRIWTNISDMFK